MKKKRPARPRTVPSLAEREKLRTPKEPPKPKGKILPFNPNAPKILETADTRFIEYRERLRNFPWKRLSFTFILILAGGVGSAAFQARNASIQNEINRTEREIRQYQMDISTLGSQLQERYTFSEIERIALEQLNMSYPDASQIVNIHVPRIGGVTLNTAEYALPRQNYFWNDISAFFSELFNNVFGGGRHE